MHQQNNVWQRIKIASKILLVFAVIFQEFFIAKTRKYMVLLSINIITIDLTSLFDFDPKNGNETPSVPESPKKSRPLPSLEELEKEEPESNWKRNLIILCVGVGCLVVAGGLFYYYFGPVADVTVAASSTATPPPVAPAPPVYDMKLVLKVFGYRNPAAMVYLQTHCASLNTDFMDFTKILAVAPDARKSLLKALDTKDSKESDRIIALVCDMVKDIYKSK